MNRGSYRGEGVRSVESFVVNLRGNDVTAE